MPSQSNDVIDLYFQKICCINNAGFVMDFSVRSENGNDVTPYTSSYPINQSMTIDLENLSSEPLEVGSLVYPHVRAYAGLEKDGVKVRYAPNGQVATYTVNGTTLIYSVERIG